LSRELPDRRAKPRITVGCGWKPALWKNNKTSRPHGLGRCRQKPRRFVARTLGYTDDIWAGLLASGSIYWLRLPAVHRAQRDGNHSGLCSGRPRLQRRDRDGVAPSSLFSGVQRAPRHPGRRTW